MAFTLGTTKVATEVLSNYAPSLADAQQSVLSTLTGPALDFDPSITGDAQGFLKSLGEIDTDSVLSSLENFLAQGFSADTAWKFIVAPENIEWSTSADVNRIPIFGSNQPPVVVGAKGMRDLELGNAMVEGFTRGVTVEGKVQALEDLLNYSLNTSQGFVNVPVYQVTANDKQYGSGKDAYDGGYFVIKEVRVKETMRDFAGNTTRAFVDVSFTQIPPYQVDGGRDQATNVTAAAAGQSNLQAITNQLDQIKASQRSGTAAPKPKTPAGQGQGGGSGGRSGNGTNEVSGANFQPQDL